MPTRDTWHADMAIADGWDNNRTICAGANLNRLSRGKGPNSYALLKLKTRLLGSSLILQADQNRLKLPKTYRALCESRTDYRLVARKMKKIRMDETRITPAYGLFDGAIESKLS